MKNPYFRLAALLLAAWCSGCTPPLSMVNTGRLSPLVEMHKGPCYGRCPVYELMIYDNGVASYRGERYTDKMGLYLKQLTKSELQSLNSALRQAELWKYNDVYRSEYPDLPAVSITYHEEDRSKTILGKESRPDAVIEIEGMLTAIANAEGWRLRSAPDYGLPPGSIPNELIVELREDANQDAWIGSYSRQELKLIKRIWPSNSKLLLSYSLKVIDPPSMIDLVRQDVDVISAEFNRK